MRGSIDVEFKELDRIKTTLPDSVSKEIVAFANTEGGELFNRNEKKLPEASLAEHGESDSLADADREAVYVRSREQGGISRREVEEAFGFGSTKAYKVLKMLCEDGLLVHRKRGKQTIYVPAQDLRTGKV